MKASEKTKRKIGIFGGTFDPIHYGHLVIAQLAVETCQLDELFFVPAGNPPHKNNDEVTDAIHRYQMTSLALSNYPQFHVCDYEIKRSTRSYTLYLLHYFKEQFQEDELYLIMGADSFRELALWYEYPDLFSICQLIVMNRGGEDEIFLQKKADEYRERFQGNITLITTTHLDISSSMIRQRVEGNLSLRYLMPDNVIGYIENHQLYQKQVKGHA